MNSIIHKSKTLLISHEYKFIFIHNYKVAGTSIRKALSPYQLKSYWLFSNCLYLFPNLRQKTAYSLQKHSDVNEVKKYYNLNDYFVFGLVRNPWDWEVSKYFYMKQTKKHFQYALTNQFSDFSEYLKWRKTEYRCQLDFFSDDKDNIITDYICKVEELDKMKQVFLKKYGLEIDIPVSNKSKHNSYLKYYNDESKNIISDLYKRDIEHFGYSFS